MQPLPKGVDLRPSGSFRARLTYRGRTYASEWDTPRQAAAWIQRTRRDLAAGIHPDQVLTDPETEKPLPPTLEQYLQTWLAERRLKPRTRDEYRRMLPHLAPLGHWRLDQLTREHVKGWHDKLDLPPSRRAHVYSLLRAVMNTAVDEDLVAVNPCRIRSAGQQPKRVARDLPTPVQVHQLADAMPDQRYRLLVLISAWCALRFGEATELRRKSVILDEDGVPLAIHVPRAVVHLKGESIVDVPKSSAGVRVVTIPPHIRGDVSDYLDSIGGGAEQLLFPATRSGGHMRPSSLYRPFYRARAKVGLGGLHWHDLRHFSGTTAAQSGATLAELMARLGHSTVAAALVYQHATPGRDQAVAEAMSNVIPLAKPKAKAMRKKKQSKAARA